jgi:xanthine dehydrogenase YagR molybdenum-binding subunit
VQQTVAKVLGIPPENVQVVCPFVGGGFGCKGSTWSHVVLAAMAARAVRRPVKLVLARPQMFGPVGGRPMTEQRIVLGARRDGRLTALRHDVISHTSFMEDYAEASTQPTRALYACDSGATTQRLVRLNLGVPTFQRAPGEATGSFAIESAMDELAVQLGMDPLALRLANHADTEPSSGKPWTSKQLRECYRLAAGRFGWSQRNPKPGSMRDGDWLIGWGIATATYPAHRMPATAGAKILRNGLVIVQSGTQELGTGTYTIMTQIAADTLGIPVDRVRFELGDTTFPTAPISGGSMTAGSVGPAVQSACKALREKILAFAAQDPLSSLRGQKAADLTIEEGRIQLKSDPARGEDLATILGRRDQLLEAKGEAAPGEEEDKFASRSFGAVFTEIRIHQNLRIVRVPRIVATYSVGRLMNAKTARSQLQGGIVWGLGQALFERSDLDQRYGRFANGNLAEYHVPSNADVGEIDVSFVDENDTIFNPVGGRGIGEIGITGVPAAVANALYHATGKRIRALPVTIDKLL